MFVQEVFHCDIYDADLSVHVCKKRRNKTMLLKLQYILDPYERCGTCKQALNVDADEIELFKLVYDGAMTCVVSEASHFNLPSKRIKPPVRLLQSPKVRRRSSK